MAKRRDAVAEVGLEQTAEHDRFRWVLELHMQAKLAAEKLSYRDLTRLLWGKKAQQHNYVFRAAHASYGFSVPEGLHKILNWLELEPRDFAEDPHPGRPGDLEKAVLCYRGLPHQQRVQLLEIVRAFVKTAARE